MIYSALRSRVGMVVDPGASTLHDSTHLFPLAALGWKICVLETGEPLDIIAIAEDRATEHGSDKALPPTIAFRNERALELLQ